MTSDQSHSADRETEAEKPQDEKLKEDGDDSSVPKPDSPFDFLSTYRYFRYTIVSTEPFGRLIWDIARIIVWVAIVASFLFFLTGLSSPFVAVSSGSMEPNIKTGDLLVITEYNPDDPPPLASNAEIQTKQTALNSDSASTSFGQYGDVIVFKQEEGEMPVLHRAHFWVDEGDNWVEKGDPELLADIESCDQVDTCPAPNDGYITAGDANGEYDQIGNGYAPVTEAEIIGVGQYRIPWLGWIRIFIDLVLSW